MRLDLIVLHANSQPGLHVYPEGMLVSILVGYSATDENIDWLKRLLGDNGMEIPIYRVALRTDMFDLERRVI